MVDTHQYNAIRKLIDQADDEVKEILQLGEDARILKSDQQKRIVSFFFPPTQERLVLKIVYPKGNGLRRFFNRWERSLCLREYKSTLSFFAQGIAVPEPIFCGEKRHFGLLQKGYYLAKEISGIVSLKQYLAQLDPNAAFEQVKEKRQIISRVGEFLGAVHSRFMYHGELMPYHIMLARSTDGYQVYLLDLEFGRVYKEPHHPALIKDLRKLNKYTKGLVTRTDRLRFSKAYCRFNPQLTPRKLLALLKGQYTNNRGG
jgi:tRNA A-37 threonylcarbamoyl transferase component Bud32